MRIRNIFLIFLFILITVACQKNNSSILNDVSCKPPCWQQIYPGLSTVEDVLIKLPKIVEVDQNSIYINQTNNKKSIITWEFISKMNEYYGTIECNNNIVVDIEFLYNDEINLGDFVKEFGKPEMVSVISGITDSRWLSVAVLYPSKGIFIEHYNYHLWGWEWPKGDLIKINPNMSVQTVMYFDPKLYDELLKSNTLINQEYNVIKNSLHPWNGFGEVNYLELFSH